MITPENRLLSPVDAAWLNMDRPQNPMVVTALLRVQGLTGEGLRDFLQSTWLGLSRFRSRPVNKGGAWWWMRCDELDIDAHLKCTEQVLPNDDALCLQVAACQMEALPRERPLWKFWHFPMADGAHAVVLRLHHCYADGISLIRLFEALTTDVSGSGAAIADFGESQGEVHWREAAWQWFQEQISRMFAGAGPREGPDYLTLNGMRLIKELGDFLLHPADTPSALKATLSGRKQCCWSAPVPLHNLKAAARRKGCTLNDVLLACVATALQRQLSYAGESLEHKQLQAAVPVDIRPLLPEQVRPPVNRLSNFFGTVFVPLPMDAESMLERVYRIKHETRRLKHSWQPALSWGLLGAAGYLPLAWQKPLVDLFAGRASAVVSNVPGAEQTRYLAGHAVREHLFWVPQAGNIGAGVSIMSYAGQVQFGVQADTAVLTNPRQLLDDCLAALAEFEGLDSFEESQKQEHVP